MTVRTNIKAGCTIEEAVLIDNLWRAAQEARALGLLEAERLIGLAQRVVASGPVVRAAGASAKGREESQASPTIDEAMKRGECTCTPWQDEWPKLAWVHQNHCAGMGPPKGSEGRDGTSKES